MFVVWLTRAGHLNSTELLRYKVLQLYNALRLCGAVRQIVRKENYMNNFRKLITMTFALVVVIVCFMSSTLTASALSAYCSTCGKTSSFTYLGGGGPGRYPCSCDKCGSTALLGSLGGPLPGGGTLTPSHTHNYSTAWGAWRKISSCRLPG